MKEIIIHKCLEILKRQDIKNEIKTIMSPIIDLILNYIVFILLTYCYESHPPLFTCICIFITTYFEVIYFLQNGTSF